ncbi:unnamed protein product, partial [marine sediment metagenome]
FIMNIPEIDPEEVYAALQKGVPPSEMPLFMPVPSNFDPGAAPPGKQLVIAAMGASSDPRVPCDRILDGVDAKVKELYPEIEKHEIWQLRTDTEHIRKITGREYGDVIGLAQIPGQVGKDKPSPRLPIAGLWVVGCDAGARGIGTEQAATSGMAVSSRIIEGCK